MARRSVTTKARKVPKKAVPAKEERVSRDRVITFRISAQEASLIAKAADRAPLARYSRDAVLARAQADTRGKK